MRLFLLLLNDSFTLLNAELNYKGLKETNKLYNLDNFNTTANNFVRSLTFILQNFSKLLESILSIIYFKWGLYLV
jgi:hypothetical protein